MAPGAAPPTFVWRGRVRHSSLPDAAGGVRPVVAAVIDALRAELGQRATLLWLTASSGYLEGRRPADLLDEDPGAVMAAAARQAALSHD